LFNQRYYIESCCSLCKGEIGIGFLRSNFKHRKREREEILRKENLHKRSSQLFSLFYTRSANDSFQSTIPLIKQALISIISLKENYFLKLISMTSRKQNRNPRLAAILMSKIPTEAAACFKVIFDIKMAAIEGFGSVFYLSYLLAFRK